MPASPERGSAFFEAIKSTLYRMGAVVLVGGLVTMGGAYVAGKAKEYAIEKAKQILIEKAKHELAEGVKWGKEQVTHYAERLGLSDQMEKISSLINVKSFF